MPMSEIEPSDTTGVTNPPIRVYDKIGPEQVPADNDEVEKAHPTLRI